MFFGALYRQFLDTSELHKVTSYVLVIFENDDDAMCILPHQTERATSIATRNVTGLGIQQDDYGVWYLGVCVSGEIPDRYKE